jgi:cysteinyl-tRNA synthetase
MPRNDTAPQELVNLADARAVARRARDWPTADRLRGEIEAAGWKVIDAGTLYSLERAGPPDVAEGGVVRYGASMSVPSRLEDAPVGVATVVMVATDWPDDLARALRALVDHSPDGTQLVVVANAASAAQAERLAALDAVDPGAPGITTEVVWTSERLGQATALNAGIRRAAAPVVVLLDTSIEPRGDLVGALTAALDDPTVAVTGPFGIVSADLRRFEDAPVTAVDVDAIDGCALAFRRSDYAARGPLDEHFAFYRNLDVWWSLVLRDRARDRDRDGVSEHAAPGRALRVSDVPLVRHEHRGSTSLSDAERDRLSKRNYYRLLKRFAARRDLLAGA